LIFFGVQLRGEDALPTIGNLFCNGKDRVVVEYALSDIHKPKGVTEYELTRALPDELKSALLKGDEFEEYEE